MPSIKQAVKTSDLTYEMNDIEVDIVGAPDDCDWSRWGMLDDRKSTRMYCFKKDTKDQLYQFLFDGKSYQFEENYSLTVTGLSDEQNTAKMGMLSTPNFEEVIGFNDAPDDQYLPIPNNYHVYMQKASDPGIIYQFIWRAGTAILNSNGLTRDWFGISAFPDDTDWDRWTMTYDSNHYQLSLPAYVFYAFKKGSNNKLYFGRYGAEGDQKDEAGNLYDVYSYDESKHPKDKPGDQFYGQAKCGVIEIKGLAEDIKVTDLSMVFDGINTYLYLLTDENE